MNNNMAICLTDFLGLATIKYVLLCISIHPARAPSMEKTDSSCCCLHANLAIKIAQLHLNLHHHVPVEGHHSYLNQRYNQPFLKSTIYTANLVAARRRRMYVCLTRKYEHGILRHELGCYDYIFTRRRRIHDA